MSKDRTVAPPTKHKKGKGKRVVAVSQPPPLPPQPKPGIPKPGMATRPKPAPAPVARPERRRQPEQPTQRAERAERAQPERRAQRAQPAAGAPWTLSLEAGLYLLLAVVAFGVRVYALGRFPLQEAEGVRAWAAWNLFRGLPETGLTGQSPLPIFGAMVSFILFGASDATARLLPALAGGVCALMPYVLRRELGRAGALAATAILALAPSFVFASRTVSGGMIVAAGALGLAACALAYRREARDSTIYAAAVILGVMFAADKTAGPTLIILGLFAAVSWRRSLEERNLPAAALRTGALIFVAVTIALGTGLLSNLQGVQSALVDPLTVWLTGATVGDLAQKTGFYVRVLLAYEPLILVFAAIGALWSGARVLGSGRFSLLSLRRAQDNGEDDALEEEEGEPGDDEGAEQVDLSLRPFLIYWSLASLIFYLLLGDQSTSSVAMLVLPMALLAGHTLDQIIESSDLAQAGRDVWLLAFVVLLITLAFLPWLNPSSLFGGRFTSLEKRIQNLQAIILAAIILLMAVIAAWYAYRLRLRATLMAVAVAACVLLAGFTVHSSWQLNHVQWPNATEPMLLDRTAADVFLLLDDIREVSRRQGDDAIPISLDDRIAQPVRWYLRQFLSVTVARTSAATKTPVVIIPAEAKDAMAKSLGRGYVNQRYRILSTWQPQAPIDRWLRWAHVREQVTPPQGEEIYAFYKLIQ